MSPRLIAVKRSYHPATFGPCRRHPRSNALLVVPVDERGRPIVMDAPFCEQEWYETPFARRLEIIREDAARGTA